MADDYLNLTHAAYAAQVRERVLRDAAAARKDAEGSFATPGSIARSLAFADWAEGKAQELITAAEAAAEHFNDLERGAGKDNDLVRRASLAWDEQMGRLYDIACYAATIRDCPISRELEEVTA